MFAPSMRAFRLLQRGHRAMENDVAMPLAFDRLTPKDKADLARRMAARRGVSSPTRAGRLK
jgi:hypothetical protein